MKVGSFSSNNDTGIFQIVTGGKITRPYTFNTFNSCDAQHTFKIFSTTVVHMPTKEVTEQFPNFQPV